jgi:hypothetical protein
VDSPLPAGSRALQNGERIGILFVAGFLLVLLIGRHFKKTVLLPLIVCNPLTYVCALALYFISRPLFSALSIQVFGFADPLVYVGAVMGSVAGGAVRHHAQ